MANCICGTCRECCEPKGTTVAPKTYKAKGCTVHFIHLCPSIFDKCKGKLDGVMFTAKGFTTAIQELQTAIEDHCNFDKYFMVA